MALMIFRSILYSEVPKRFQPNPNGSDARGMMSWPWMSSSVMKCARLYASAMGTSENTNRRAIIVTSERSPDAARIPQEKPRYTTTKISGTSASASVSTTSAEATDSMSARQPAQV